MKNLLLCLALVAPVLASAAPAPAADSGPAPVAVVDAFHAALKSNDPSSALKLLSVNASVYEQGFVDQTRSDYAGAHIAADAAFAQATELQVLERRIIWLGDNAACVISRTHTQGAFQGHPINLVGTETMVLQRSGSSWSIEHVHWSAHPAEGELKPADDKPADKPADKPEEKP
ncbi:MAG: nuclear transport factor 2 family protein [Nevskia sp.]|nr:nuclear transport factor 2 family protein [Nevskia sp.]